MSDDTKKLLNDIVEASDAEKLRLAAGILETGRDDLLFLVRKILDMVTVRVQLRSCGHTIEQMKKRDAERAKS